MVIWSEDGMDKIEVFRLSPDRLRALSVGTILETWPESSTVGDFMPKLVLFGTGQMTTMIHFYLTHDSSLEVAAFTVNAEHIKEKTLLGLPVVPFEELERSYPPGEFDMSIPISYRNVNQLRAEKYQAAKAKGYRLVNYISSKAVTW